MAFVDPADLALFLGEEVQDIGPAAVIACRIAEEVVRGELDQQISLIEDDEITLDGTGTDALLLPERPVTEVSTVSEAGTELTVTTDYLVGFAGILYRVGATWPKGRENIAVKYTHGWSDYEGVDGNQVPLDIRAVTLSIAKRAFEAGSLPSAAFTQETIGSYSYSQTAGAAAAVQGAGLRPEERTILARYKASRVA